jgi:hypothetical protein
MYAERFLIPLKHFAFEKLRYKKAWLYFLTENIRNGIDKKMNKEFAAIDPKKFLRPANAIWSVCFPVIPNIKITNKK